MGDKTLHFRFSSLTEFRRVLESDLLKGRLLVPYRAEPLELYDDLIVRVFVGERNLDIAATVVAPKVTRGRRTYVGLSVTPDPGQVQQLKRMAAQSSSSSPDSAGHLFKDEDSTDLEELRSTMEERLFGDATPPAQAPDTGEHRAVSKPEWKSAVVPRFAPDAYFPHVQTNARPLNTASVTRWPTGLPPAELFERARDGSLDEQQRTTFLAQVEDFVGQARELPVTDLLGIGEHADEESIHQAFQRLTTVLGTRNPMQTLDLDIARANEVIFDILIRARDSALAGIVRSGGSLRRAVAPSVARRDSAAALPQIEQRPSDTGDHRPAAQPQRESVNRTQFGSILAFVDDDSGPVPGGS